MSNFSGNHKHLSVNFHLWQPCNYKCGFCFAGFEDVKKSVLPKGHLSQEGAEFVVRQLADYGFGKITFAGGEPTLCPWLGNLMEIAKKAGMVTMVVTNGSRLTREKLEQYNPFLDWVVLSIDSIEIKSNLNGGRFQNKHKVPDTSHYSDLITLVKQKGFKLKINTVVQNYNKSEIMSGFIEKSQPLRWKLFKVLSIENQNSTTYDKFEISNEEFDLYLRNNETLFTKKIMVPEDNSDMTGSYLMLDPAGRFFDNSNGIHNYSQSICKISVDKAIMQVDFSLDKFKERGGLYKW